MAINTEYKGGDERSNVDLTPPSSVSNFHMGLPLFIEVVHGVSGVAKELLIGDLMTMEELREEIELLEDIGEE
ncbi:hypothetical protein O1611_g1595 [Lasiodiplodia mahajangana]|uniref:Uncharacterized protein n=1 Tax=Lasiodiplodia mahajangana TaxID=1108764 RepID=A0ACC2JX24_9PEZI|nr:hypothetical protein O1611_g1595 [Lasiodiplodia mahajangana]